MKMNVKHRWDTGRHGRGTSGPARRLTVLKLGGSLMGNGGPRTAVLKQVADAWARGEKLLIVHGGGSELSGWLSRLGIDSRFIDGQRVTTEETLPVALMVLGGLINRRVVEALLHRGCPAIGLTGADGGGTDAVRVEDQDLGAVGRVVAVNAPLYQDLLDSGRMPVVASLTWSAEHGWLNVNADLMAAALAAGLGARRLILMTDVPGVQSADGTPLSRLTLNEVRSLIDSGAANNGMIPKLLACHEALRARIPEVLILGPCEADLTRALVGSAVNGTRVVPEAGRPSILGIPGES
jgi:acetylglutamate kinase